MNASSEVFPPGFLEQDEGWKLKAVSIVCIVVVVVTTIMRLCSRHMQKKGFLWADIWIPISLMFNATLGAIALVSVNIGVGKHVEVVSLHDRQTYLKILFYAMLPTYTGAVTFPKLAVLDLYLNIFVQKFSRYVTWTVAVIQVLSGIANFIATFVQCQPFDKIWTMSPDGHCDNVFLQWKWGPLPSVIIDFVMLLLPIQTLWRLQASWRVKVGLAITFAVGSMGLATSIVRFYKIWALDLDKTHQDITWFGVAGLTWTVIEAAVYHLCACSLTFRPLFRRLFIDNPSLSSMFGHRSSSNSDSEGGKRMNSENSSMTILDYRGRSLTIRENAGPFDPQKRQASNLFSWVACEEDSVDVKKPGIHIARNVEISHDHIHDAQV